MSRCVFFSLSSFLPTYTLVDRNSTQKPIIDPAKEKEGQAVLSSTTV